MRSDAENIKILEQLKPKHEHLKTIKIKLSAEAERLQAEIQQTEQEVLETLGTLDPTEIEKILQDAWADNSHVVDEFEAIIKEIDDSYRALAGNADQPQTPRIPQAARPFNR